MMNEEFVQEYVSFCDPPSTADTSRICEIESYFSVCLPEWYKTIFALGQGPYVRDLRAHNTSYTSFDFYSLTDVKHSFFEESGVITHSKMMVSRLSDSDAINYFSKVIPIAGVGTGTHLCLDYAEREDPSIIVIDWTCSIIARDFEEFLRRLDPKAEIEEISADEENHLIECARSLW